MASKGGGASSGRRRQPRLEFSAMPELQRSHGVGRAAVRVRARRTATEGGRTMTPNRADELAQDLIPERATRIMVDTRGGDRRVYSADEWREHLVAALRAYAEEARQEESKACANM